MEKIDTLTFNIEVSDIPKILLQIMISSIVVIAPAITYFKQYSIVYETKKVGSFSLDVCAILLFGQALRIFFW